MNFGFTIEDVILAAMVYCCITLLAMMSAAIVLGYHSLFRKIRKKWRKRRERKTKEKTKKET